MISIGRDYFVTIGNYVNSPDYNKKTNDYQPAIFSAREVGDFVPTRKLVSELTTNGFAIIDIHRPEYYSITEIEHWLKDSIGDFFDRRPSQHHYDLVQASEHSNYYISSALAQPLHTDEGYTRDYPAYAALYCQQSALVGGDTTIVKVKPLYAALCKCFGSAVQALFKQDAVTIQGAHGIISKPLLFLCEDQTIGISYSPVLKNIECNAAIFEMYKYITEYIHTLTNQVRFKLQIGQILLFDNRKVLHGRTAFPQDSGRKLYRFWFKNCKLRTSK